MASKFSKGVPLAKRNRICPLIFLIDVSESMEWPENGCPINAVNEAIEGLLPQLIDIARNDIVLRVACLQFHNYAEWLVEDGFLEGIEDDSSEKVLLSPDVFQSAVRLPLEAGGVTNFRSALQNLNSFLSSKLFAVYKFVTPIIMLITDGHPTDEDGDKDERYKDELNILLTNRFFKYATRVAIGYGKSVKREPLQHFACGQQSENVLMESDSQKLREYIRLVTMRATQSSIVCDPFNVENVIIK